MKKILILQSSARIKGNTARLAAEFARGASDSGNEVETVNVALLNIHGCLGCGACQRNGGKCVQKDDMQTLYPKLMEADIIVLATPVYYYEMNAQMKLVLDRTFALNTILKDKGYVFITTGAAPEESYFETIINAYHKYISCFEGSKDIGIIIGGGTTKLHDIEKNDIELGKAYNLGKNLQ